MPVIPILRRKVRDSTSLSATKASLDNLRRWGGGGEGEGGGEEEKGGGGNKKSGEGGRHQTNTNSKNQSEMD
jgi:hypothetical protein